MATTPTEIYQIDYEAKAVLNWTSLVKNISFEVYYFANKNNLVLFTEWPISYNKITTYNFT